VITGLASNVQNGVDTVFTVDGHYTFDTEQCSQSIPHSSRSEFDGESMIFLAKHKCVPAAAWRALREHGRPPPRYIFCLFDTQHSRGRGSLLFGGRPEKAVPGTI
jgi:hypothetical protein